MPVDTSHKEKGKLTTMPRVLGLIRASRWSTAVPCSGEAAHSSRVVFDTHCESVPMWTQAYSLCAELLEVKDWLLPSTLNFPLTPHPIKRPGG